MIPPQFMLDVQIAGATIRRRDDRDPFNNPILARVAKLRNRDQSEHPALVVSTRDRRGRCETDSPQRTRTPKAWASRATNALLVARGRRLSRRAFSVRAAVRARRKRRVGQNRFSVILLMVLFPGTPREIFEDLKLYRTGDLGQKQSAIFQLNSRGIPGLRVLLRLREEPHGNPR